MHYISLDNWDPATLCWTATGFGAAQAYQLLPLEEEEPEGEQIVSVQNKKKMRGGKEMGRQRRNFW